MGCNTSTNIKPIEKPNSIDSEISCAAFTFDTNNTLTLIPETKLIKNDNQKFEILSYNTYINKIGYIK